MTFPELLNEYLRRLHCTAGELAESSGLTQASLSRYRNGQRVPDAAILKKLAVGIVSLAEQQECTDFDFHSIFSQLTEATGFVKTDPAQFSSQFAALVDTIPINLNELAKSMGYDPSYLSRIKKGQRMPADVIKFTERLSSFLIRKYGKSDKRSEICKLIGYHAEEDSLSYTDFTAAVVRYLCSGETRKKATDRIGDYLKKLDEFDLNEYMTRIQFDQLKVPTVPFHLPSSKNYYGIEQMKQGELDFFKATALSRSKEPIFMNSDMPMADMAQDMQFNRKWMFGIAACLKKGLHLHMIHHVDRPMEEMILGLEAWIPIYMTGQISPYYLKNPNTDVYHHLNYVSGAAALSGECIHGYHKDGKYYLTNLKQEVAYYRTKTNHILSKALPLMEIYTAESKEEFHRFLAGETKKSGKQFNLYTTLPFYTISKELLQKILNRNHIAAEKQQMLLQDLCRTRTIFLQMLLSSSVEDRIPVLSQEAYREMPLLLPHSEAFYEDEIHYTYEEYLEHFQQTMAFAEKYKNYVVLPQHAPIFRNIQIQIKHKEWVIISKNKSPVIHFVIQHPKLRTAIEEGLWQIQ